MISTKVFSKEFTIKLCERFKFVKSSFEHTKHQHPFDMFGVECDQGWNNIVWELCENIERVLDVHLISYEKFVITQIKEKYGLVRVYYTAPREIYKEVDKLIFEAEMKSNNTCELCGKDGKMRRGGWLKVLCDECQKVRYTR